MGASTTDPDLVAPGLDLVATAYPRPSDAVDAILEHLRVLGFGRWRLADATATTRDALVALVVPGHEGQYSLAPEADVVDLRDGERPTVLAAARVIATLLSIESNALRASEHAERAERESTTDALTGVANARAWWRTLAREADLCELEGATAVVAVIDLDGFKAVNDASGHLAGDELLRTTARALRLAVRPSDTVARVGGDEFGVLVVDTHPPDPAALTERLQDQLRLHGVVASVGAAELRPGERINEAYHRADIAMYGAKALKRARRAGTADR